MTVRVKSRNDRVVELYRMRKAELCALYRNGIRCPDGSIVRSAWTAHPLEKWRKDEIVSSILSIEYPS